MGFLCAMSACTSQPPAGSLEAIEQRASLDIWGECIKTQFDVNRQVLLWDLSRYCRLLSQQAGR